MVNSQKSKCENCGSSNFEYLHPGIDRLHGFDGEFSVASCSQCGLIALHPKLSQDEMEKYYPTDYISYPKAAEDETFWLKRMDRKYGIDRRCKVIINRVDKPGTILDIGCATGNFLNGMQQYGWDCYGVEPSEYAANYAIKRFNLPVINGYLTENQFDENYFDVVTLWDVFEHLPHPKNELNIIKKILKPGGLLIITTPNTDAWGRKLFGKYWVGWDVPRHYHVFSPSTIQDILNRSSFETQEIISFTGRHGAFVISLQFFLFDKKIPAWSKKAILTIFRSLFFRLITYPFFLLAERSNHSSIMTVVAKKAGRL